MKTNSLNNRFYPHNEIRTDCIINMDDDSDMPYSDMAFAIDTWRGHFFNNLVGFSHLGSNHIPTYINVTLQYVHSNKRLLSKNGAFYSIVHPSWLVFHRRYLYQYTYKLPQSARDLQGPVVIDAWEKPYNLGGLWKRRTHMETRTLCLNKFVEIFGGMPLKYTTKEARTEDSVDSLSEVSSLDDDFAGMHLESTSSDEEVTDNEMNSNVWSEIESESDGEFLEDHGIVEQVTPISEDGTINPIDCYRHFIIDEIISLMVRETNRYAEQYLLTHKLNKRSKNLQ
ncbi:unnamed protein product [Rotaria sp. Silwood1]|nr:unnamed protein product [Rotaria sp. Silwood1]CAF4757677.1 unnamed protein product [Rotaria sp. Silwood1]CAF4883380.1 unnamed protein product [Rotaria sp. Silwood1]CAF4997828.1 unnamed protein product [Rotaria sp. Silwood1]